MSRTHTNTTSVAVQGMVVGSRERECWRRNAEIAMRPFLSGWGVGTLGVQNPLLFPIDSVQNPFGPMHPVSRGAPS